MAEYNLTVEEVNRIEQEHYLPLTIFLVIVMVLGIIGNTLVIIIFKYKFKRSSARVYIIALALADLIVCVVGIPYHVLDLTWILTYQAVPVCRLLSFGVSSCTLSSVLILLVVGLDRYLKVCRPLKKQIRDFGDRKACIIVVAFATLCSVPDGILYGSSTVTDVTGAYNVSGVECFMDDEYINTSIGTGYLGFKFFLFVISVAFLVIIYSLICRKIYQVDQDAITLDKPVYTCFCCKVNQDEAETESDDLDYCEEDESIHDDDCVDPEGGIEMTNLAVGKKDGEVGSNENLVMNGPDGTQKDGRKIDKTVSMKDKHKEKEKCTSKSQKLNSISEPMMKHTAQGARKRAKNTKKITMMMFTITVVFIIVYLPFIAISFIDSLDEDFWKDMPYSESIFYDFLLRIYILNNVANPFIYSFWDKRFRTEVSHLVSKILCCIKFKDTKSDVSPGKSNSSRATCSASPKSIRTQVEP